jgi:Uma2 family endonuclease
MRVTSSAEDRVLLDNIRWSTYLAILEDAEGCRGRMSYDRGTLEIMSPSRAHEKTKKLLARMIEVFTEERSIESESAGSTTFTRSDLQRGFEPDECYYLRNAARIRGQDEIDLSVDPPPDLLIEVEFSRSALQKLEIFRSVGVPEVWRCDGQTVTVLVLRDEAYEQVDQSHALPGFPVQLAESFLRRAAETDESRLIREFRTQIRSETGD